MVRGLGCGLWRLRFRSGHLQIPEPAKLDLHEPAHGGKFRLQVLESAFVFGSKLLDQLVEMSLCIVDLLLKQAGTILQVATDVTHCLPPQID